ncbi:hypothetical protein B5F77_14305 [Parabacteroides sp. An277]|nr:hypothetical protein B5F77_14305 [Parabacteroides sp. An277]
MIPTCRKASRRCGERFRHVGKPPDNAANDSDMSESLPTTQRTIPTCRKASRQRGERFRHVGKPPDDAANDSDMSENFLTTQRTLSGDYL